MTSAVDREDVQAELYRAGIRSGYIVSRLMSVIDAYARTQLRQHVPLEDIPVPPPAEFSLLLPGEWDMSKRVTRCKQCGVPKKWELFGADKDSPTGHKMICKSCVRGPHHQTPYEEKRWLCPACSEKKPPSAYPQRKRDNPRIRAICLSCEEKTPGG